MADYNKTNVIPIESSPSPTDDFCRSVQTLLRKTAKYRMRRTTALGMFKDCAIILYAIRRSFLKKSATAGTFISVRVDF
jgi:hypothetical protein